MHFSRMNALPCATAAAALLCVIVYAAAMAQATPSSTLPAAWHEDAELRDVSFVDRDFGWAVGDLGTIWHTENGGEIWRRQPVPVSCQLSCVHFVNRELGWIAGGFALPGTARSKGVILETTNGGKTWTEVSGLLLPWISHINFSTENSGHAAGLSTPFYPTGVWSTADGGKTWSPIQGAAGQHWADADLALTAGLLISHSGAPAWLIGNRLAASNRKIVDAAGHSSFAALINDQIGFAGGRFPQMTVDRGSTWLEIGQFPRGSIHQFSFDTMATSGANCWLAGSPGTRIFHSHDHAKTWRSSFSGNTLPIRRLCFVDSENGWGVGAYGQILRTEDGGESWRVQRGGAKRAALLGVFADEREIPWESLARTSASGEYRVHIAILAASHDPVLGCPVEWRLQDAAQRIGASAEVLTRLKIDSLVAPSASDVIRNWEAQLPDPVEQLSGRLTQLVRTWRPDVALTSNVSEQESGRAGVQGLLGRLLVDACEFSASEHSFPDQLAAQGLQTWSVSRVLAVQELATQAATAIDEPTAVGSTVEDLASRSSRLLVKAVTPRQPSSFVALGADGQATALGKNPFSGLNIPYDSAARRRRNIRTVNLTGEKKTRQRSVHVRNLLRSKGSFTGSGAHRIEQAAYLLESFDYETAGELLYRMAENEIAAGRFSAADPILRRFIARYNEHGLADQALQWLVTYHTSYEQVWRDRLTSSTVEQANHSSDDDSPVQLAAAELAADEAAIEVHNREGVERGDTTRETERETAAVDWRQGLKLARELKSKRPALYAEPVIVFPVAAITRDSGQTASAQAFYRRAMALPASSPWRQRAATELALLDPQSDGSASSFTCVRVDERPHLDGFFSDTCWEKAQFMTLQGEDSISGSEPPLAELALVHDDEFLYVAARCAKYPNARYLPARRPRPRDADLVKMDRIRLSFDINRDYVSWWQFEIDHRGWSRESLLEDTTWNPKYFLASAADESNWSIELAIPLRELAPRQRRSSATWAIGVTRLVPGKSIRLWKPMRTASVTPDLQGIIHVE